MYSTAYGSVGVLRTWTGKLSEYLWRVKSASQSRDAWNMESQMFVAFFLSGWDYISHRWPASKLSILERRAMRAARERQSARPCPNLARFASLAARKGELARSCQLPVIVSYPPFPVFPSILLGAAYLKNLVSDFNALQQWAAFFYFLNENPRVSINWPFILTTVYLKLKRQKLS